MHAYSAHPRYQSPALEKKENLQYPPLWKLAILISAHLDVKTALTGYPGKPATAEINTLM